MFIPDSFWSCTLFSVHLHICSYESCSACYASNFISQIEEQVMEALKKLYIAQDNPDEYITVERCRSRRSSSSRQLSQNSPWGRDIR